MLALPLLVLAACAPVSGSTAAAPPAPAETVAELQARTREFSQAIIDAGASGWSPETVAAVAAFYADDIVVFPPRGDPIRGHAAIRAYWTRPAERRILAHSATPERIDASGDLATEHGQLRLVTRVGDGAPVESTATYISIWRRIGGEWRKQMDSWW